MELPSRNTTDAIAFFVGVPVFLLLLGFVASPTPHPVLVIAYVVLTLGAISRVILRTPWQIKMDGLTGQATSLHIYSL